MSETATLTREKIVDGIADPKNEKSVIKPYVMSHGTPRPRSQTGSIRSKRSGLFDAIHPRGQPKSIPSTTCSNRDGA